jgi:5-methylcytosine-specific restriction endonuclease McrA
MRAYTRGHLSDRDLRHHLTTHTGHERTATAVLLADLAEFDARRLYVPDGYASMSAYCVGELHLSEDAAYKRIQAARKAREFPAIFPGVEEGRLHLSAVLMLAPHLTRENADELLATATHRSRSEIEQLLAERFPKSEMLALVQTLPASSCGRESDPGPARESAAHATECVKEMTCQLAPGRVTVAPRSKVKPHAPGRFELRLTIGQEAHDDLRCVQALLSHQIPAGDIAQVIGLALKTLRVRLEKRKFAKTDRPRTGRRRSTSSTRHIPAQVKRAVYERDQGQCTFVGENGHRCEARKFLEYDHVDPVARGGQATVENIQLRCRVHNQHEAERVFGAEFMSEKREEARRAAEARRARAAEARARATEAEAQAAAEKAHAQAAAAEQAKGE